MLGGVPAVCALTVIFKRAKGAVQCWGLRLWAPRAGGGSAEGPAGPSRAAARGGGAAREVRGGSEAVGAEGSRRGVPQNSSASDVRFKHVKVAASLCTSPGRSAFSCALRGTAAELKITPGSAFSLWFDLKPWAICQGCFYFR